MKKEKKRHFFAGGNTAYGFYSLFQYITHQDCNQLMILKGGPGTGKSTLMKQIGEKLAHLGFIQELFHCSSDQDSLDGIAVPELGFAMVDGTAPHVIDPKLPGAYDQIINLGTCWDAASLKDHKKEIAHLFAENSSFFIQAYQYLKEAHAVMEKNRYLMSLSIDKYGLMKMSNELSKELFSSLTPSDNKPSERHLFAGAITPGGLINYYPSIIQDTSVLYLLTGDMGSGKSDLLKHMYRTAAHLGYDVEVYHCAFDPDEVDCVVVPAMKTAFAKATYPHSFPIPNSQIEQHFIAVSRYSRPSTLKNTSKERSECQDRFWYLVDKAIKLIQKSKNNHDRLEEYYIKTMDYNRVGMIREEIIEEVLGLATAAAPSAKLRGMN